MAYDTTSNDTGFYSVPGLFAGNYTLTFSAPGMKKHQASVALQSAQDAVISPKLTVGGVADQVTVLGNDIQLATYDSGTISTQLDSKRIDQLPQNGRNVLGLAAATTPGLEAGGQRAKRTHAGGSRIYPGRGAPMTNRNFGGEGNSTQAQLPDANPNNGITGLPSGYTPYQTPINHTPGAANYGTNNVLVPLKNGTSVLTAYSPGPAGVHPFSKTTILGPFNYIADMSIYKVFSISERLKLRLNVDAFNAFNIQGRVNPNTTDGTEALTTSYWTPRQVQISARFSF